MNLANKITIARIFLVPVFMLFATLPVGYHSEKQNVTSLGLYIATALFLLAAATDKLDGYIARKHKQITKLGIFLDPLADKLLITAALICLVNLERISTWVALVIVGRELIVTLFRLSAAQNNKVIPADKAGKIKMVVQVIAIVFSLTNNYPFNLFTSIRVDIILMYLAVIITIYSGVNYIIKNLSIFEENKSLHL